MNELLAGNDKVKFSDSLHLAVSLRSFRAETLSAFIHSLLSFAPDAASLYQDVKGKKYPIMLTRDMESRAAQDGERYAADGCFGDESSCTF